MRRSEFRQHGRVLGLTGRFDLEAVKHAFRRITLTAHPDRAPPERRDEATRHYEQVSVAYEALRGLLESGDELEDEATLLEYVADAVRSEFVPRPIVVGWLTAVRGGHAKTTLPDGRLLELVVPSGVEDGTVLRAGPHGRFVLRVLEDEDRWTRQGDDLEGALSVTWLEAWRGDVVEATSPWGTTSVSLPSGTRDGSVVRAEGHGVRPPKRQWGDLLLKVQLRPPPPPDALPPDVADALADAMREAYARDDSEKK